MPGILFCRILTTCCNMLTWLKAGYPVGFRVLALPCLMQVWLFGLLCGIIGIVLAQVGCNHMACINCWLLCWDVCMNLATDFWFVYLQVSMACGFCVCLWLLINMQSGQSFKTELTYLTWCSIMMMCLCSMFCSTTWCNCSWSEYMLDDAWLNVSWMPFVC